MFKRIVRQEAARRESLVAGCVVPDPSRCVQCSICTYNCPIGIDVRLHAWTGEPVEESYCLTCGECIRRCPRGALRLERTNLFHAEP